MQPLGLGSRLWLAFIMPWRLLFDAMFAARVAGLDDGAPALPSGGSQAADDHEGPRTSSPEPEPVPAAVDDGTAALQLLSIMQREGRLIDFLHEDLSGASDGDIGAAARVVHEGCKRGLGPIVEFAPIRDESEGDAVQLADGFDAARNRVTGNVVGDPPYAGKLAHHGWVVRKIDMPAVTEGHDPKIIAPAEVEL